MRVLTAVNEPVPVRERDGVSVCVVVYVRDRVRDTVAVCSME